MADVELSSLGSVIKTAYEGEAETNAYTDAEKAAVAALGTAAAEDVDAFATGAEGELAASALQPADIASGTITPKTGDLDFNSLGGGGASAFVDLTDTPADYSGQAGKLVKVNPTADGLIYGDPSGSSVSWGDITGTIGDQTDLTPAGIGAEAASATSIETASFTAEANGFYLIDLSTAGADVTMTLPASASVNDRVSAVVITEERTDHSRLLVGRNGHNLAGSTNEQVCSINVIGQRVDLVYSGDTTYGWHTDVKRIVTRQSDIDPAVTSVKIFHDGTYPETTPNTYGIEIVDMGDSIDLPDGNESVPVTLSNLGFSGKLSCNLKFNGTTWEPVVATENANMLEIGREGCWFYSMSEADGVLKPTFRGSGTGPRFNHVRSIEAVSYPGMYLNQCSAPLFWDITSDTNAGWSGSENVALTLLSELSPSTGRSDVEFRRASNGLTGITQSFGKARGTSSTPLIVSTGDYLGILDFAGHDGTDWQSAIKIITKAVGTPANNDVRAEVGFYFWNGSGHYEKVAFLPDGGIRIAEQAAADADTAGFGQLWVKNDTPNKLYFTDDAGTDYDLTAATGRPLIGVVTGVSGTLTEATHHAKWLITSGNVTVPHASGSKGFYCEIEAGGAHTVTFNSTTSAAMATGDIMTVYVTDDASGTPTIKAVLTEAANLVAFT